MHGNLVPRLARPVWAWPIGRFLRRVRLWAMPAVLCASLVCVGATPALAGPPGGLAGLQSDLSGQMQLAGSGSSAYVYDITAKQVLFSARANAQRAPASVEKLYTATTALERMGPTARLATTVL